jgi:hypothetical protein
MGERSGGPAVTTMTGILHSGIRRDLARTRLVPRQSEVPTPRRIVLLSTWAGWQLADLGEHAETLLPLIGRSADPDQTLATLTPALARSSRREQAACSADPDRRPGRLPGRPGTRASCGRVGGPGSFGATRTTGPTQGNERIMPSSSDNSIRARTPAFTPVVRAEDSSLTPIRDAMNAEHEAIYPAMEHLSAGDPYFLGSLA